MKQYKYNYAIKLRGYGSYRVKRLIKTFGGSARFVYNRLVYTNKRLYALRKVGIYMKPVADEIAMLEKWLTQTGMVNSAPFLKEVDSCLIANAKQNYNKAWNSFHNGNGRVPTFHKKTNCYKYQTNPHYEKGATELNDCTGFHFVDKNHIVLPKIGKVRVKGSQKILDALFSRDAETRFGTVTVTLDETDKIWISVQLASDEPFVAPYPKTGTLNAFDMNLSNFLTDYYGNVVDNPHYLKKSEEKLKRLQRKLSLKAERAKQDGRDLQSCKNYQALRREVAALHKHVANQRKDFQHTLASKMLKNHDIVFAEDLKVKNLMANHSLAKAIADVSWSGFLTIMEQKAELRGKTFMKVPAAYTTQTCSDCGYVMGGKEKILLGTDDWTCPSCGAKHNRDHNAAINIMNKGKAMLPS